MTNLELITKIHTVALVVRYSINESHLIVPMDSQSCF